MELESSGSLKDAGLFQAYGQYISSAYPLYLKKLGLHAIAVKAEGATIIDAGGRLYIDCVGGYGIFNLGHNHPKVMNAVIEQIQEKQLLTKPFITEMPIRLAESLSKTTAGELTCSFICNSGSEAIDTALKLARLHTGKKHIIAAEKSFHGYTFGALSVSGIPSFKRFFEPLLSYIDHVPFGDIQALKNKISSDTAAILLEPVQHEAGVSIPPKGYFDEVRRLCDEKNIILILDEIKTGFGKTGRMFAYEHFETLPDILALGKSLGGGLIPIGAIVAKKSLWKKFGLSFPMSASSFAGNVLACRAGLATIDVLQQENLIPDCAKKGAILLRQLSHLVREYPFLLTEVKGLGLLIGVETTHQQKTFELSRQLIRQGVLALPAFANPSVLMIEPPLVISFEQIETILDSFQTACKKMSENI